MNERFRFEGPQQSPTPKERPVGKSANEQNEIPSQELSSLPESGEETLVKSLEGRQELRQVIGEIAPHVQLVELDSGEGEGLEETSS